MFKVLKLSSVRCCGKVYECRAVSNQLYLLPNDYIARIQQYRCNVKLIAVYGAICEGWYDVPVLFQLFVFYGVRNLMEIVFYQRFDIRITTDQNLW